MAAKPHLLCKGATVCIEILFRGCSLLIWSSMASSSSRMSKTLQRMLVRTQALVESGVIEQPKWLDAVRRSVATLSYPPPRPPHASVARRSPNLPACLSMPAPTFSSRRRRRHPQSRLLPPAVPMATHVCLSPTAGQHLQRVVILLARKTQCLDRREPSGSVVRLCSAPQESSGAAGERPPPEGAVVS